jgi:hypothetical protein
VNPGRNIDAETAAADIRFVTRGLGPEEIAAATAVLSAAIATQHAAAAGAAVKRPAESEWTRSTRGLRQPLRGGWRGFTAEGL